MLRSLAVNGSPRSDGITGHILRSAAEKMERYDIHTDIVNLGSLGISHCRGCMKCKETCGCAIDDDMTELYGMIRDSDILIFGSPVYFGAETGLMKNFIDRMYATISVKDGVGKTDLGRPKKGSVLLTCGSPDGDMRYQSVNVHLMGFMRSVGITDVSGGIVPSVRDVEGSDHFMDYMDALDLQLM